MRFLRFFLSPRSVGDFEACAATFFFADMIYASLRTYGPVKDLEKETRLALGLEFLISEGVTWDSVDDDGTAWRYLGLQKSMIPLGVALLDFIERYGS